MRRFLLSMQAPCLCCQERLASFLAAASLSRLAACCSDSRRAPGQGFASLDLRQSPPDEISGSDEFALSLSRRFCSSLL